MFFFSSEPFLKGRNRHSPFWGGGNRYFGGIEDDRETLSLRGLTDISLGVLLATSEGRRQLRRAHLGVKVKDSGCSCLSSFSPFGVWDNYYYYDNRFFFLMDFSLDTVFLGNVINLPIFIIALIFTGGFFSLAGWGGLLLSLFIASAYVFSCMFVVSLSAYGLVDGFSEVINLFKHDVNPLVEYLKNIPSDIKVVDLQNNALGVLSVEDLCNLLQAIPATVEYINLSDNALFDHWKSEEMRKLIETKLFDDPRLIVSEEERAKFIEKCSQEQFKQGSEDFFLLQAISYCKYDLAFPEDMMGRILEYGGNFESSEIKQVQQATNTRVQEYVEAHPLHS